MSAQPIREESFSPETHLHELRDHSGGCISIYLPLDGAKEGANLFSTRMKAAIKLAGQKLKDEFGDQAASAWPPEDLANFANQLRRGPQQGGLAIFSFDGQTRIYHAPKIWDEFVYAGNEYYIRPLLSLLVRPAAFYLLALSEQNVRLLRCANQGAEAVKLPKSIPMNLDEAMLFEPPDHRLEHGSASGPMPGQERGIRFGTSADDEKRNIYLRQFFSKVDAALRPLLTRDGYPLMLAGVKRQLGLYSGVNTYEHLLAHHVEGSPRWLTSDDLHQLARGAWDEYQKALEEDILREFVDADSHAKLVKDVMELLPAIESGKIHHLVVPKQESDSPTNEMVNHLALAALRHGSRVSVLNHHAVPGGCAAGILRYGRGKRGANAKAS